VKPSSAISASRYFRLKNSRPFIHMPSGRNHPRHSGL